MNITKSLLVAALLSCVAAASFAQAPDSWKGKDTQLTSATNTVQNKKHRHHHHHHHHARGAAEAKDGK